LIIYVYIRIVYFLPFVPNSQSIGEVTAKILGVTVWRLKGLRDDSATSIPDESF